MAPELSVTALWWAVIVSGLYHGLSPGMGWPLAVSAGLMERTRAALPKALGMLALGHFGAMLLILLPFSMLTFLVDWQWELRVVAASAVIVLGCYLLYTRRHPRFLARVHPARLGLWSFLAAMAHGAGLMLVPIYLGLCGLEASAGHRAAQTLMSGNIQIALLVAVLHTLAMTFAGSILALGVYFWLGLKFLTQAWFNLDTVWAVSLIGVGIFALAAGH